MMKLVQKILVVLVLAVVPVSAFDQRKGQDKRPPKDPVKVIENRKDKPPPPKDDRPKKDDKKRPKND